MTGPVHGFTIPFRFPVHFTRAAWDSRNLLLVDAVRRLEPQRRHRVLVVIDDQVARAHPDLGAAVRSYFGAHSDALELVSAPVMVPGGEAIKNDLAHPFSLLQMINEVGLDRQSCVMVVGGGAVLDMVSFAAAIAHRGIRVLRLPTTVLAQADSGIAVKNSVNLFGKKNFIGTFVPPFAVVNDTDFLQSLSARERIAGLSEAVKVSLLREPGLFRYMESNAKELSAGTPEILAYVVQRSAELHLAHICGNGDPFELGSARPLDFGHWAAHKLETMTSHRVRHGEAVAIGMALDLTYSVSMGFLDSHVCERILRLLEAIGLPLWDAALLDQTPDRTGYAILAGLQEFREHLGGELHVTMLRDVGASFEVTEMDDACVAEAIEALAHRALRRHARKPMGAAAEAAL